MSRSTFVFSIHWLWGPMGQENDLVLNTLTMEQTREYTKKMGRWRRRALEVTGNIIFWACMHVMFHTRAPLMHFSAFLKQIQPPESPGKICEMVNGKCAHIMAELWLLFHWSWENVPDEEYVDELSLCQLVFLKQLSFAVICKNASQFYRRIFQKMQEYPIRLFGLIKSPPHKPCQYRKKLAAEILQLLTQSDSGELDRTTSKIFAHNLFKKQLQDAQSLGTLGEQLFAFISLVSKYLKVDVRENERVNKLLSMLGDACPNANLVTWI